jgi:hypothetical protein
MDQKLKCAWCSPLRPDNAGHIYKILHVNNTPEDRMHQWYDSLVQVASQERNIPSTDGLAVFFQRTVLLTAGFIVAFQMP